ncbi:hypothetical protein WAI453_006389 [Rhynchosporium graminicola]|uniref:Uncharacterized protein n=1 Tax=Rhynchosporium graminicola TaxID=2792576 RepID=A0A1E1LI28_9HELO|nr:uncharacterized protein RCO7_03211 [Rhynchosporium commune]
MVNIVDENRCPGNFILNIASTGLGVVASLSHFGYFYRIKCVANNISLSASILNEVGRGVNQHETLFKDNFEEKFSGALKKCKKEYEQVAAALDKIRSYKKNEINEETEGMPKSPLKKLMWGLDMTLSELNKFENELDQSRKIAFTAQTIVQLVILQVNAQKRELSEYEQLSLRRVKKDMGDTLELLHRTGVGNVMMFSLREPTQPANTTQVAQAADNEKTETRSIASLTIRNPTELSVPTMLNFMKPGNVPMPPPPPPGMQPFIPYKSPDIYELHRISADPRDRVSKETTFRFLGIPLKINRKETQIVLACDKVSMSQDDIKKFMVEPKDDKAKQPVIDTLMRCPSSTSGAIYSYLSAKTDPRNYQTHTWTVECVVPTPTAGSEKRRFWSKKVKPATSHMIVIKGEAIVRPRPPGFRPPGFRPVPIRQLVKQSSIASRKAPKPVAKFELSQQETEIIINDYLASFTILYDGVPVEERGAALKAIVLPTKDDSDYDSASCSSGSSRSLVDD